ncbi:MAG: hypothetical protein ACREKL_15870 [Chthoniobacterales bacterium]
MFEALERVSAAEAGAALDWKGVDPVVGIVIAEMHADAIEFEGQTYHIFAARVFPRKQDGGQPYVTPHLHKVGCEPYFFLDEGGEMHAGNLSADGATCIWQAPVRTESRVRLLIRKNEVHSFRNVSERPSDFLFACPRAHLIDHSPEHPEGDRYIVDFPGGN